MAGASEAGTFEGFVWSPQNVEGQGEGKPRLRFARGRSEDVESDDNGLSVIDLDHELDESHRLVSDAPTSASATCPMMCRCTERDARSLTAFNCLVNVDREADSCH